MGVLHQPQPQRAPTRAGVLAGQLAQAVPAGQDVEALLAGRRVDERVDGGADAARQAKDGLQAAFLMGPEKFEAVVAAIVDDQVGSAQSVEMEQGGGALVAVREEVEIDRDAGLQPEQATEQALGVVGLRAGRAVAGCGQWAGQVQFGAVDGEHPVAVPETGGQVGAAEDLGMELLEDLLVDARAGLAHRGVGDRLGLGQGHVQGAALGPQLGQRGGVTLAARGEHETEHEQHHQQSVEHPAALLPLAVMAGGQGAERTDQTPATAR